MSENTTPSAYQPPAEKTADEKSKSKQNWLYLVKLAFWINAVLAGLISIFGVLVLDLATDLADYHGAGKIAMTVLYVAFTFVAGIVFLFFAEGILGAGGVICYIAWSTITGSNKQPRRKAASPTNTTSNNQVD